MTKECRLGILCSIVRYNFTGILEDTATFIVRVHEKYLLLLLLLLLLILFTVIEISLGGNSPYTGNKYE